MPVNLAPNHKYGLVLPASVMPAAGMMGYGEIYRDLVDVEALGALVTHPLSLRPRRAARGARVAVHGDHLLIHTGWPNRGLRRAIRRYGKLWSRYPVPIIVHLLATTPGDVGRAAARLSSVEGVAGVELGFASETSRDDVLALVAAATFESAHPLIAKLPANRVRDLAPALIDGGVDALTLTAPPRAVLPLYREDDPLPMRFLRGRFYGPARFPILLDVLATWASELSVPVIACGGISTAREALACLTLGAAAVQVEACLWRDPTILNTVATALAQPVTTEETGGDEAG